MRLHVVGDRLERRHGHRPLLAGLEQAGDQLLALEPLAAAVLLDHHVGDLVDPLVAGEAAAALEALAAPADDVAFLALARVHDLVAQWPQYGHFTAVPPPRAGPPRQPAHAARGSGLPAP